jgi:phosphoribosylformylglycinamidine synthase
VYWIRPRDGPEGLPDGESLKKVFAAVSGWARDGLLNAAATPGYGGAAEAVYKMALGNRLGFAFDPACSEDHLFGYSYGSFVLEMRQLPEMMPEGMLCCKLGHTLSEPLLVKDNVTLSLEELATASQAVLEGIFPCGYGSARPNEPVQAYEYKTAGRVTPLMRRSRPKVLIPAFPGTNSEYDSAKAMAAAGADPQIVVIRNLTASDVQESARYFARQMQDANIVFIPGGFSGGDEPDGSGKFITAFFRHPAVREETERLLAQRDGLMIGICNGFQALIKLGLLPWGKILPITEESPTVTFNAIGRHKADIVRTRIASDKSPWLAGTCVGDIYSVPISHGEGRFVCNPQLMEQLVKNGQIAAQYVDEAGNPTMSLPFNPNGSAYAVEAITSPDGRVLGKMGHFERWGDGVFRNVPGRYDMKLFESAVAYFR